MYISTTLQQLGYPPHQVEIYLASLKMGEATIADIAEQVTMARTTVSELLEDMHKRGLINYYEKKGHKYWVAEDPDKLMMVFKEREAALQSILPQLNAMQTNNGSSKPKIQIYTGLHEVKKIYSDLIDTKHHIMAMVAWNDVIEFFGDEFIADFIARRSSNFLKIRLITPKTNLSVSLKSRDVKELRQTRFLPDGVVLHRVCNFIYNGKVAVISLNRKVPTGVVIEDQDVAYAHTVYFESLWQRSMEH